MSWALTQPSRVKENMFPQSFKVWPGCTVHRWTVTSHEHAMHTYPKRACMDLRLAFSDPALFIFSVKPLYIVPWGLYFIPNPILKASNWGMTLNSLKKAMSLK